MAHNFVLCVLYGINARWSRFISCNLVCSDLCVLMSFLNSWCFKANSKIIGVVTAKAEFSQLYVQ